MILSEQCSYCIVVIVVVVISYRENPALGDPNSLVEELLQIRNKVRMRESDMAMVKGKVSSLSVCCCLPIKSHSLLQNDYIAIVSVY